MKEFRCSSCNKLLGMIDGKAEIKCPKCKTLNKAVTFEQFSKDNNNFQPGSRIPVKNVNNGLVYL